MSTGILNEQQLMLAESNLCLAVAEYQTVAHALPKPQLASLLIQCPDQKGVVAALAQLLYGFGCNILESDQYTDQTTGTYFQR